MFRHHSGSKFYMDWMNQSLQTRQRLHKEVTSKYTLHIPVILKPSGKYDPELNRYKFLVTSKTRILDFLIKLRTYIKDQEYYRGKLIILYINGKALTMNKEISDYIYSKEKDGFLYVTYMAESAFGHN